MRVALFVAVAIALILHTASAQTYVFKTTVAITVDGNLSDWSNASVLSWKSPRSGVEYNYVYLLHDDSNYYIAMKIYDDDNVNDDSVKIYLNSTNGTFRFDLQEGSSTLTAYRYDNGSWVPVAVNYSLVYEGSSISDPYSAVELRLSKDFANFSADFRLFVEHTSSHIKTVYSWYPPGASFEDFGSWELLRFIEFENRTLDLSISDRNGVPIYYATDDFLVDARYSANGTHIVSVLGKPNVRMFLPPTNVTVSIKFLNVTVFEKSYDLTLGNVSDSVSLNNLLKVDTPSGYLVVSVEKNGTLKSVDFNYSKGRAVVVSNSTEVFLDSKMPWKFLAVLYSKSYEYNPVTGHLLVNLTGGNDTGFVLVLGDANTPVLVSASGTVKFVSFYSKGNKYTFYVDGGEYKFSSKYEPFSIALNGTALRRGVDYSTDEFNTTTVSAPGGLLEVYYENPTSTKLEQVSGALKLFIATPYNFTGKVHYVVKKDGLVVEERNIPFDAKAPLTEISVNPSVRGEVVLTVFDSDSNRQIFRASVRVTYADYTMAIVALVVVIASVAIAIGLMRKGKEKAVAKMEKEFRFFRRLS